MPGKFIIEKIINGQFMFNLQAENGETILTSETYVNKEGVLLGINAVRTSAPKDNLYERRTSISTQPYFILKSSQNQIIGVSEMYYTHQARDNGIEAVKHNAPTASIYDDSNR